MLKNYDMESVSAELYHDIRKGYRYTKAKSHKLSLKAGRDKGKDKRARREARLNKLDLEFR